MENTGTNAALLSYVPMDRLQALVRGSTLPADVTGAAVEADLSGFTALTESLARRLGEHHGAEELARRLDVLFGGLVAAVHEFRGAVLAFSGDAMTCWFDGDDGRRAVAAALRMQAWITESQDGDTVVRLKVAVGVGATRRFLVGDPEHQVLEGLAGALVDELAATEHAAEPGDIVLAPSALTALGDRVRADPRDGIGVLRSLDVAVEPQPWPPFPPEAIDDEVVRAWLLPAVYQRLRAGQADFLAELRPAVALFVRFIGIDFAQDPEALDRLDVFVRRVLGVLARYDGTLVQLTIGDKGSYLYGAFGAPVAHEDDAARAISAAAEISGLAAPDDVREISIGVTAGRLRAGAYGGAERRTYGVLGDAVNLSARLMQAAAPGEVIASRDVADAAGEGFDWNDIPPLTVKGKTEPVDVRALAEVRARTVRRRHAHDMPLLGRDHELATLRERLALAQAGRGQVVGVAAEAGMGKSRLIHELLGAATLPRYEGECQSYDANGSYGVWRPIWGAILGDDPEAIAANLARLDPALVARLPLLGPLLGIPIEDNDLTRPFDAKLRKTSLEAMLVDVLRAAADEPLVLVLDDIHWIDPLSEDLLLAVARAVHALPVLVLLAYRARSATEGGEPVAAGLPHFTELALTELAPGDVERLVRLRLAQVGGTADAVEAVADRITERAQGNPFYIEELLTYLTERGGTLPSVEELERLELPGSLHSLILSRMDRLEERPRATLKVASAVGRSFEAPVLPAVHPELGGGEPVETSLAVLREHEFVLLESEELQAYAFRHVVTQEVAYGSLPGTTRAALHGRIGRFLEARAGDDVENELDVLAHHFWLGDDEERKRSYLLRAGAAAQARYANAAAITYYRRALPLFAPPGRRDIFLKLGKALELGGSWQESEESYRSALELADVPGARAWCETALGELARKQGHYDEARDWLDRARRGFEDADDRAGEGQVLHYTGTLAAQQGDYPLARSSYGASLELRRELGDRANMASMLSNLGIVAEYEGDYDEARRFNEEALALRQEIDDRWAMAVSLNNLGNIALLQGRPEEARRLIEEAVAAHREVGDPSMIASSLDNLGNVVRELGDHEAAKALYDESLTVASQLGDLWLVSYLLEDVAILRSRTDEPERALELEAAAARLRTEIGAPRPPASQEALDVALEASRTALGTADAARASERGAALSPAAAVEIAMG